MKEIIIKKRLQKLGTSKGFTFPQRILEKIKHQIFLDDGLVIKLRTIPTDCAVFTTLKKNQNKIVFNMPKILMFNMNVDDCQKFLLRFRQELPYTEVLIDYDSSESELWKEIPEEEKECLKTPQNEFKEIIEEDLEEAEVGGVKFSFN